jgi:glycosyltransferase involved in cell wall biosynthesis
MLALVCDVPSVSVIIPVYNEAETVGYVISQLLLIKSEIPSLEIIVVDDGSSDGSAEAVSQFSKIVLIKHPKNLGKGAALKTGFLAARGRVIVVQDADLEYPPSEIPKLVKPIFDKVADVVYGSRFTSKPCGMSFSHFAGNVILSWTTRLLFGIRVTDVMTGYKAFSNDVVRLLELKENGFSVEVELTAQILKNGWRFREVPIGYLYRCLGVSKIRNRDGLKSFVRLFVCALQRNENGPSRIYVNTKNAIQRG